jgi:predicted permease
MRPLRAWLLRLGGLFRKQRRDSELADELESHLAMHIEDNVRAGMSSEVARRAALLKLGGLEQTKEGYRERTGLPFLETLVQDFRFALRIFRKNPGVTTIAVLTLALGIGANTTIFSWVRSVLLNPLPGSGDPGHVVALETLAPNGDWLPTSYLDFRDLRENCKLMESMSVTKPMVLAVGDDSSVERVWSEAVSGNFFELLHVKPQGGRFFSADEVDHQQNAHPLVVIAYSYWINHFRGDPGVIGAIVRINHLPYTVIGVAPKKFPGSMAGLSFSMWVPATMYGQLSGTGEQTLQDRKWRTFRVLARLSPGVSIEQARAEVQSHANQMAHVEANTNEGVSATLLPLWRAHYGIQNSLLGPLSSLMAAAGVLLLIVCANVANLLLARATSRQKEFSVRLALGAPRSRLVRQLLTESLLIAVAGALAGLALAIPLGASLAGLLPHSSLPTLAQAPIDAGVLFFMIALTNVVAFLAGITPALQAAKSNVQGTLKEGGRTGASARSVRLLGWFVGSEMALATVALIVAALFVKSFHHASEIHPGFDPDHVAIAQLNLGAANYDAEQANSFCVRLREKLEGDPAVTAVSYTDYVPLNIAAGSWEDLQVQGYVASPSENMKIYRALAAPGYFALMKIPLLEGRDFNARDDMNAPPVMIVNREFVRRFIPTGTAIGRRVQGWGKWFTIVGVVSDSKIYRFTEAPMPYFYIPFRQIYRPEMGLVFFVRTSGPTDGAIAALRREAQAVDPSVPLLEATSLNDSISLSLFTQRISASLLSILASVALFLAALGLYGVMGYSVAQRTNEIGLRMALGAQRSDVSRVVLGQGVRLAGIGVIAGAGVAFALTRLLSSLLVGVSASDPLIFVGVAGLLTIVAMVACFIPAWRAMHVDPMVALRYE